MKTKIDIDNWLRREHFSFFQHFEEPFHGVCMLMDCTKARTWCRSSGVPFLIFYLYQALRTINALDCMKYRVEGEEVFLYERIDGSVTIEMNNGLFGFSHIVYDADMEIFRSNYLKESDRVKKGNKLFSFPEVEHVVHISIMPWLSFTSLSHARKFTRKESIPKLTFGKLREESGRWLMPLSIHVHHGLADGKDVAHFIETYQHNLDDPA